MRHQKGSFEGCYELGWLAGWLASWLEYSSKIFICVAERMK
jgi:hypothetical protein